jgi:hypothetical protein
MTYDLDELIGQLQALPKDTTAQQAVELLFAPKDDVIAQARKLTALVRSIDEDVYRFLTEGNANLPRLSQLIESCPQDFQSVPSGSWKMTPATQELLLEEWRQNPGWRHWNTRLFKEHFAPLDTAAAELEGIYHAAAAENLDEGLAYFETRYKAADERAELSHCRALLDSVRVQAHTRGSNFSASFREHARYLEARMMFLEPLQKTAFYVDRTKAQEAMEGIISREGTDPWIFHLHATGGLGKTTLQNRMLARDLVLRRIPCAYADFDDDAVKAVVQRPFLLIGMILEQWAKQMKEELFPSAAERLKNLTEDQWSEEQLRKLRIDLQGAQLSFPEAMKRPMVVMLDTLEDVTLLHPKWLSGCIEALSRLHENLPKLTLILSGRYNMVEKGQSLSPPQGCCIRARLLFAR